MEQVDVMQQSRTRHTIGTRMLEMKVKKKGGGAEVKHAPAKEEPDAGTMGTKKSVRESLSRKL